MGTQKAIAAQIIDQGADYVLALKGNQETLHVAVIEYLDGLVAKDFAGAEVRHHVTTDKAHGREEIRCYTQFAVPSDLPQKEHWK